jgi:hypothetical protein
MRQWLTDALRPTHDSGSRQIVACSNCLGASLTDPAETNDRNPSLHPTLPQIVSSTSAAPVLVDAGQWD